jgi:peroxiredoxin
MSGSTRRFNPGDRLPARELASLAGPQVRIPDPTAMVHLQFRRFAGCPFCDLHLYSIVRRERDLTAAGIREVVVFHSSAEELRAFGAQDLPFPVLADPDKRLYLEFGVESAPRALLHPRARWTIVRAIAWRVWEVLRGRAPLRAPRAENGRLGLPADFLIARDGRILARTYGEHANDQWSVEEILEHAIGVGSSSDLTPRHLYSE